MFVNPYIIQMKDSEIVKHLIQKIAEDDSDAFNVFYDLFYLKIYRFSSYIIKSDKVCEEIVSDIFFTIWQNRRNLIRVENIEAYLYTSTRNRALYYLNHYCQSQVSLDDIQIGYKSIDEETPESIIITEELKQAIRKAVTDLPERCRLVFLMAKEEGLKYKEIAEILSISEKTVNAQIVTALKKLTEALHNYLYILL